MSDLEAARRVYGDNGIEFDSATQKAYGRVDQLRERYDAAQAAFAKSRSDKDKTAYKKAKAAYAEARADQRRLEEANPDHQRGNVDDSGRPIIASATDGSEG